METKAMLFSENVTTNFATLRENAKNANLSVKCAKSEIMHFINLLNKYARKNDIVNNTLMLPFGKQVRAYLIDCGIPVKQNDYFDARIFTKIDGMPYYKKREFKKHNKAFAIDLDIITLMPVKMTENGVIAAFQAILEYDAKKADRIAKENAKIAKKQESEKVRAQKIAARKALKIEQTQAKIDYCNGKIDINTFAAIMAKAI